MPDRPDLNALLAKWQKILRLQDWDIKISYVRYFDLGRSLQGECNWTLQKRVATIRVLDPADYDTSIQWPFDPEKTVVHELAHLYMAPFDNMDGLREVALEQAIDAFACALIERDRATPPSEVLQC